MTDIHFVMQGKGGVGKSLVASFIAQFLMDRGSVPKCFDADPVNHSFSQWQALGAEVVEILGPDGLIDPSGFDYLIEQLASSESPCVVDLGASTMLPLTNYLISNRCFELLQGLGKSIFIHVPITKNDSIDTFAGFVSLADETPSFVKIIIWVNEFLGGAFSIGGQGLEDLGFYVDRKDRVQGIVRLEKNPYLFDLDLNKLIVARQTFLEARNDPTHFLMNKQRTYIIWKIISDQLKTVFGIAL